MKEVVVAPTRSQSVGSLMELQTPAERRIKNLLVDELKSSSKRKLESAISTDQANLSSRDGGKRKDKIVKENTVADISISSDINKSKVIDESETGNSLDRSRTQTLTKNMELVVENNNQEQNDPQLQGAACVEIIEEAKKKPATTPAVAKTKTNGNLIAPTTVLEDINENPSQENLSINKENVVEQKEDLVIEQKPKEVENKTPTKKKVVKNVLGVKNDNVVKRKENKNEETALKKVSDVLILCSEP